MRECVMDHIFLEMIPNLFNHLKLFIFIMHLTPKAIKTYCSLGHDESDLLWIMFIHLHHVSTRALFLNASLPSDLCLQVISIDFFFFLTQYGFPSGANTTSRAT